jgi:DNA-directed RNA polymerase subunit RPC12/RpoP
MQVNLKRYLLYLARWQLSTPILAVALVRMAALNKWVATVIANFIGGLIFFWVDSLIFTSSRLDAQWEVKEDIVCADCGQAARGYRLVKTRNYDKRNVEKPEFRCERCSQRKTVALRAAGVVV